MKALFASAAAVALLSATPAFAQAGPESTATANADAVIVAPISVNQVAGSNLNFGKIAAAAGTVTVGPDGSFSDTPGMIVDDSAISAASFTVSGQAGLVYSGVLDEDVTLTRDGGTETMTATLNTDADLTAKTLAAGGDTINVGGVLSVSAGQAPGAYQGTFSLKVQYD